MSKAMAAPVRAATAPRTPSGFSPRARLAPTTSPPREMHALYVGGALRDVRRRNLLGRHRARRLWPDGRALKAQTARTRKTRPSTCPATSSLPPASARPKSSAHCSRTKPLSCRRISGPRGGRGFSRGSCAGAALSLRPLREEDERDRQPLSRAEPMDPSRPSSTM